VTPARLQQLRSTLLPLGRLAVLALIVWLLRDLAVLQRVQGDAPIEVSEVTKFFTNAVTLRADSSERGGLFVLDRAENELGYVARTQPQCRDIIGYCGVTDVLVAFGPDGKILGLKIRSSEDTRSHVADVVNDRRFLKKWNGMTWDAVAGMNLKAAGIEGVSGATMTSMAIAESVKARLKLVNDELAARPPLRLGWRDMGMVFVLVSAGFMTWGPERARRKLRRVYQIALVVYVGFISGDLIAQSLLVGWARGGIPWSTAPGLVSLVVAAFLLPFATGKPVYCHQICPHGAAQELLGKLAPDRWRFQLPPGLVRGLERLPGALLIVVVVVGLLVLPLDLAGLEPFDAYLIRSAGWATVAVAVVGLASSLFVPQAYCRFGCPTGALLTFVRRHGAGDRWTRRDTFAVLLLVLAATIRWQYLPMIEWLGLR
jgi:hypothetical protein